MRGKLPACHIQNAQILIIDDDEFIRAALKRVLKGKGLEVLEAHNGVEGVKLFRRKQPDVVVTDILMPEKEGLETISEIRASDPAAKIIAISGGGSARDKGFLKLAGGMGADGILSKPFSPAEILSMINGLLGWVP